jgi:hypothetical protein
LNLLFFTSVSLDDGLSLKSRDQEGGRSLRLTLLAPEIIEAIMEGRQPVGMTMAGLLTGFPVVWAEQGAALGGVGFASVSDRSTIRRFRAYAPSGWTAAVD